MVAFKNTAPVVWLLVAIAMFVTGILLIFNVRLASEIIQIVIIGLFLVVGIMYLLSLFLKTTESKIKHLAIGLLCVAGAVALYVAPQYFKGVFNLIAGMLGILIGCAVLLNAIKLKRDGAPWIWTLITAAGYIFIGILLVFVADQGKLFALLLGIYLILFSFNIFGDALVSLMGSNSGAKKMKKHVRVSIPLIFSGLLPLRFLKKVNKLVEEEPEALLLLSGQTKKETPDLIIYIHSSEGLITGTGHADLSFDDVVYSYGNYDDATWKMGGFFAEGVMVEMESESHIRQALDVEKKILMAYGLSLTTDQKQGARDALNNMLNDLIPWEPLAEQSEKREIEGKPKDYNDVASQLYKDTGARFYKFKFGSPFKTYYAMGTNCVKLVDEVVGKTGIDLLRINGIITPGAYLDYLDRLYERGDSIVISRHLYQKIGEKSATA